jgi:hypothetical protein
MPMPVRTGAFLGRSLMWWYDLSPVAHRSKNGQSAAPPKMMVSGTANGMSTLNVTVCPRKFHSQAGMTRSEPSRMPM